MTTDTNKLQPLDITHNEDNHIIIQYPEDTGITHTKPPKRNSILSALSTGTPTTTHIVSKEERYKLIDTITHTANLGNTITKTLQEVVNADIPVELLTPVEHSPMIHVDNAGQNNNTAINTASISTFNSQNTSIPNTFSSTTTTTQSSAPSSPELSSAIDVTDEIVTEFNKDPDKGIDMLIESKLVDSDKPDEIASFLYFSFGIDPDALGNYLGKKNRNELLNSFVCKNDFRGLSIADAVRHMLRKFKPQGESAIIDRVVTGFAGAWTRDNPGIFSHPDTAYQLAFATLMVNTSLHNPHAMERAPPLVRNISSFQRVVRKELCKEEINLSLDYLQDLYNSIRQRPIELVADKYMTIFRDSVRSGWVEKRTKSSVTRWKRRLLVLSGHPFIGYALYYFKAGRDRAWRMMIPLNGSVQCGIISKDSVCFFVQRTDGDEISAAKRNDEGVTEKHDRQKFVFRCSDGREAQYWLGSIQECLQKHSEHLKPSRIVEESHPNVLSMGMSMSTSGMLNPIQSEETE